MCTGISASGSFFRSESGTHASRGLDQESLSASRGVAAPAAPDERLTEARRECAKLQQVPACILSSGISVCAVACSLVRG
jgi:hypothetical protein